MNFWAYRNNMSLMNAIEKWVIDIMLKSFMEIQPHPIWLANKQNHDTKLWYKTAENLYLDMVLPMDFNIDSFIVYSKRQDGSGI